MDVLILRLRDNKELPTPGIAYIRGNPLLATLEPPSLNNLPLVSCIPPGTYECKLRKKVTIGTTLYSFAYEVTNVPNRTGIYFHKGNFKEDTHGCILVGRYFHEAGVGDSALGYNVFMSKMEDPLKPISQLPEFALTIRFAR